MPLSSSPCHPDFDSLKQEKLIGILLPCCPLHSDVTRWEERSNCMKKKKKGDFEPPEEDCLLFPLCYGCLV